MLKEIFGNYLVTKGKLTKAQYQLVSEKQASARVKLGLIAVEEKLLTPEQAEELNQLQTQMDKRFGDIAIEKGYLSNDQVGMLLKKQGNAYLQFIQTLTESGYLSLDDISSSLRSFMEETGYTKNDIDTLKNGDVSKIVPLFTPTGEQKLQDLLAIILRNVTRFVATDFFIGKAEKVSSLTFKGAAGQDVTGEDVYSIGIADTENVKAISYFASLYNKATLELGSPEVFDAVGEFCNCVNGLYVSNEASETSSIDMLPQYAYQNGSIESEIYAVPFHLTGATLTIYIAIGKELKISGEAMEALAAEEIESANKDGKKILIVDDSRISRKVLRDTLEAAGYCVVGEAVNGQEAVKAFLKLKPDLCTMDITMPIMDGIQALKEIKALDANAKVVMLSAAGMKSKVVEAVKLGAADFISKPFEKETVEKVLKDVLA